MLKVLKLTGIIVLVGIGLYGVSFLFSNVGHGPSNDSKVITGQSGVTNDTSVSYSLLNQSLPEVKAASYLVLDLQSDQIILQRRPDSALLVASLTKLMTAWIVVNYGQLSDQYQIQTNDTKSFSPELGLVEGDVVLVSDLLNAMLVGSANDAAISLSHYIETKQNISFTELMNQEVENLKLTDTRFSNPNGFDSETNYSSSQDLFKLYKQLSKTKIFDFTARATNYSFAGSLQKRYQISATNELISKYKDLYAIKTGFTNEAQGSMINILQTPETKYLIIVLGSPNREQDTLSLRKVILQSQLGNQ